VQGEDAGFIKFGSRVDLFLPVGTDVKLVLDQVVRGGETIIAEK
jgi:phosphatidylserine decarboxylase